MCTRCMKLHPKKRPGASPSQSKAPSKQPKLESVVPQNDAAVNKAFDDALVDFLAESGIAFKRMMNIVNRRIKVKHPMTYNRMVKNKAEKIKKDLINILTVAKANFNCVGFTTDLWTFRSGNPFMSLDCSFDQ